MPELLLKGLKLAPFQSRAGRMGKVVRVSKAGIHYWEFGSRERHDLTW